jgi:hypothetical protein
VKEVGSGRPPAAFFSPEQGGFDPDERKHDEVKGLWPSTLPTADFCRATGSTPERLKEWSRSDRAVIQPVECTQGTAGARYARADVPVAIALRALQAELGEKNPLAFAVIEMVKAWLHAAVDWNATGPQVDPVSTRFSTNRGGRVPSLDVISTLASRPAPNVGWCLREVAKAL